MSDERDEDERDIERLLFEQSYRCKRCWRDLAGVEKSRHGDAVYCLSCRLKEDAPMRVAKAVETRRARESQRPLLPKHWMQRRATKR